jgi:hypothetical protein
MQKSTLYNALTILLAVTLTVASASVFAAQPKSITLKYEVMKGDQLFAHVKEQYTVTGDQYKIESTTKGVGVYALFGERKLNSEGAVTNAGLVPKHFELHQGNKAKRTLITNFDWANNQLLMQVKGKVRKADLLPNTQDLASYAYHFMHNPSALNTPVKVNLTTGKKIKTYTYSVSPETLTIDGKQVEIIHLSPVKSDADKASKKTKEFWLAKQYHYVPVRIVLVDKRGQQLEQTLTSFEAK